MKILLALTNANDRVIVSNLLLSEGHEIIIANNGNEVSEAMHEKPNMLLLDANLPEVSGYECCRLIKLDDENRHLSTILLMPVQDSTAWARFSECGADDFILHPLHLHVIKAKMRQLQRIRDLYQRLDSVHRHAEQEIRLAKHMFDSITKRQPKGVDFLDFWGMSVGYFCGDLFIFERTPENHLHIFLGDFTGHGLSAAMGALPVSDTFFAMTRNGDDLEQIISEVNRKLYEIMPTGKFCAGAFLRLEADHSSLKVWNGGLPPILFANRQNTLVNKCESFHLPLGISPATDFNSQITQYELHDIQSVVLCSDGLIEAQNSFGEAYGEYRLAQVIASKRKERGIFNKIKSSTLAFLEGLEPHDDVSLAVININ